MILNSTSSAIAGLVFLLVEEGFRAHQVDFRAPLILSQHLHPDPRTSDPFHACRPGCEHPR